MGAAGELTLFRLSARYFCLRADRKKKMCCLRKNYFAFLRVKDFNSAESEMRKEKCCDELFVI